MCKICTYEGAKQAIEELKDNIIHHMHTERSLNSQ